MATYVSTKETTNYARLSRAVVSLSSDILRDVLESWIKPQDIKRAAEQKRKDLKTLRPPQWDKINNAHTSGYGCFDITLLYSLLRVVSELSHPRKGWGQEPDPSDVTIQDDIERIRILRNTAYGHIPNASVSDQDLKKSFSSLNDVCKRIDSYLSGKDYAKHLSDIETCTMDPDREHEYTDNLQNLYDRDQDILTELGKQDKKLDQQMEQVKHMSTKIDDTQRTSQRISSTVECNQTYIQDVSSTVKATQRDMQTMSCTVESIKNNTEDLPSTAKATQKEIQDMRRSIGKLEAQGRFKRSMEYQYHQDTSNVASSLEIDETRRSGGPLDVTRSRKKELTDKFLLNFVARKLGNEWQAIAIDLNLRRHEIDRIQENNNHNVLNQIHTALTTWRNKVFNDHLLIDLLSALRENGREDIAYDIEKHFGLR